MIGTVCVLVSAGSTLWGTRHADSARSATATTLDTPLPFAQVDKARAAPAPIHPPQGRSMASGAPVPWRSATALSGFQDIVGPLGKSLVAFSRLALEVAENRARIDAQVLRRLG